MSCSCGSGSLNTCCPTCQPAQSIFQGECSDPGTLSPGRFLQVLDYKFCERRLSTGAGFLVSNINGSGNAGFSWTETPQVQLTEYLATANTSFGNLVVMGSDARWRYLQGPSTLGLFLQTDSNGMLFFGDPPAATVPDPLAINDLNVANEATINDLTTNGTLTLNNLASGTVVNLLGVDVSNEVVLQAITAGAAACMFYESPTSPGVGAPPNKNKVNGEYLVIGNRLFDSGSNLISVTTSEAITVNVTGKYLIMWVAEIRNNTAGRVGAWLEINNTIVNVGNGRLADMTNPGDAQLVPLTGFEARTLTAGDVIKLQLQSTTATPQTFEARLIAFKFAD